MKYPSAEILNKPFAELTEEQQDEVIDFHLSEYAHWLGGFDKLRERIKMLEENAEEDAWYRSQQDY